MSRSSFLAASLLLCFALARAQVYFDPSATTSWDGRCASCPITAPCNFAGGVTQTSAACELVFLAGNTTYTKSLFIATAASGSATMRSIGDAKFSSSVTLTFSFGYMGLVIDGFTSSGFPSFTYVSYQAIVLRNSNLTLQRDFEISAGGAISVTNSTIGTTSTNTRLVGNGNGFAFTVTDSTISGVSFAGSLVGTNSLSALRSNLQTYIYSRFTSISFVECTVQRSGNFISTDGYVLPSVSFQKSEIYISDSLFNSGSRVASVTVYRSNGSIGAGFGSNNIAINQVSIQRSNLTVSTSALFALGPLLVSDTSPNMSINIIDSNLVGQSTTPAGFMSVTGTRQVLLTFVNSPVSLPAGSNVWGLPQDVKIMVDTHLYDIACSTSNATVLSGAFSAELSGTLSCASTNGTFTLNTVSALLDNGLRSLNNASLVVNSNLVYHVTNPALGGISLFPSWKTGFSISWASDVTLPSVNETLVFVNSSDAIPYIGTEFDVTVGWYQGQTNVTFNQVSCNSGCVSAHMSTDTCVSHDRCSCTAPWGGDLCDCDLSVVGTSCNPLPPSYPPDQPDEAPNTAPSSSSTPSGSSGPSDSGSPSSSNTSPSSSPSGSKSPTGAAPSASSLTSSILLLVISSVLLATAVTF